MGLSKQSFEAAGSCYRCELLDLDNHRWFVDVNSSFAEKDFKPTTFLRIAEFLADTKHKPIDLVFLTDCFWAGEGVGLLSFLKHGYGVVSASIVATYGHHAANTST